MVDAGSYVRTAAMEGSRSKAWKGREKCFWLFDLNFKIKRGFEKKTIQTTQANRQKLCTNMKCKKTFDPIFILID